MFQFLDGFIKVAGYTSFSLIQNHLSFNPNLQNPLLLAAPDFYQTCNFFAWNQKIWFKNPFILFFQKTL